MMNVRTLAALIALGSALPLQSPSHFVLASVADHDNAPVIGLTAEDFVLQEGTTAVRDHFGEAGALPGGRPGRHVVRRAPRVRRDPEGGEASGQPDVRT